MFIFIMNLEILKNQIEKLRNMKYMKNIFKIIVESDEQYIFNENGIFIPMEKLKIETINKIDEYIKSIDKNIIKVDEAEQKIKKQNIKKIHLSRHERNLLNKINIKDIFNE